MRVTYASNACVLICKQKRPKNNCLPRKQKMRMMKKLVPAVQAGCDNIQYMFPVACDDTAKGTRTTETENSSSFDEKTENSSAPFKENLYKKICSVDLLYQKFLKINILSDFILKMVFTHQTKYAQLICYINNI